MVRDKRSTKIFESMIDLIARKYSYLAIRQDEFANAKLELEQQTVKSNDDNELVNIAVNALSQFKDGHLRVINDKAGEKGTYRINLPINYHPDATKRYLSDVKNSGPITIAKIEDIIYIGIDSLAKENHDHFDWMYSQKPPPEKKFIVDLRKNGGGDESLGKNLVKFMLGAEGPFISSYYRFRTDENDPRKLTEFRPGYIYPETMSFRREVVVLTGASTYSSGENITLDLAAIPGTLLIGDVTGGGSGCPQRYVVDGRHAGTKMGVKQNPADFGARFALAIPSWLHYRLDQVLLEGNGINPHILIRPRDSIVNGRDMVLEKAIDALTNGYLAR